jgi:hypothetical protein
MTFRATFGVVNACKNPTKLYTAILTIIPKYRQFYPSKIIRRAFPEQNREAKSLNNNLTEKTQIKTLKGRFCIALLRLNLMDRFWIIIAFIFVLVVVVVSAIYMYSAMQSAREGDIEESFKITFSWNDFLTIVVLILIFAGIIIGFAKGRR